MRSRRRRCEPRPRERAGVAASECEQPVPSSRKGGVGVGDDAPSGREETAEARGQEQREAGERDGGQRFASGGECDAATDDDSNSDGQQRRGEPSDRKRVVPLAVDRPDEPSEPRNRMQAGRGLTDCEPASRRRPPPARSAQLPLPEFFGYRR